MQHSCFACTGTSRKTTRHYSVTIVTQHSHVQYCIMCHDRNRNTCTQYAISKIDWSIIRARDLMTIKTMPSVVKKYFEVVGKKPRWIQGHSCTITINYRKATTCARHMVISVDASCTICVGNREERPEPKLSARRPAVVKQTLHLAWTKICNSSTIEK